MSEAAAVHEWATNARIPEGLDTAAAAYSTGLHPEASVVMPSRGRAQQAAECVERLLHASRGYRVEVIVVTTKQDKLVLQNWVGTLDISHDILEMVGRGFRIRIPPRAVLMREGVFVPRMIREFQESGGPKRLCDIVLGHPDVLGKSVATLQGVRGQEPNVGIHRLVRDGGNGLYDGRAGAAD